jgi:hypothetical protein
MISAIFAVIGMVLGLIVDIVTFPIRAVVALVAGAGLEFRWLSRRR